MFLVDVFCERKGCHTATYNMPSEDPTSSIYHWVAIDMYNPEGPIHVNKMYVILPAYHIWSWMSIYLHTYFAIRVASSIASLDDTAPTQLKSKIILEHKSLEENPERQSIECPCLLPRHLMAPLSSGLHVLNQGNRCHHRAKPCCVSMS